MKVGEVKDKRIKRGKFEKEGREREIKTEGGDRDFR